MKEIGSFFKNVLDISKLKVGEVYYVRVFNTYKGFFELVKIEYYERFKLYEFKDIEDSNKGFLGQSSLYKTNWTCFDGVPEPYFKPDFPKPIRRYKGYD